MDKKRVFSSIPLLLGTLFLLPAILPAHGQMTGTVCIIPSNASACPSSSATVVGTSGTQLRVSVFIQGSDGINGFDVTLLADHTILKPAGADLTGSVLVAPQTVVLECLGGVLVSGSFCSSTDTVDTLHFVVAGALGQLTVPPTTGLLFTAIYNVTADTTGIPLGYQTGCSSSSVSGTTTCVTITNGGVMPVPENVQTAVFTTADFSMTANPTTLILPRGTQGTSTITLTSLNSFTGNITLSSTTLPAKAHSPTTTLSTTSITLVSGGTGSVTVTISTSKNTATGSYTVTITGTGGSRTHTVSITVTVTH
jgi:hypothetical protein